MSAPIKGADERELLPCPFCGHKTAPKMTDSEEYYGEFFDDSNDVFFAVICDASKPKSIGGCGAAGGFARTEEEAIAKWNLRASLGAAQVPAVNRETVVEWLDANDIEVTDRQLNGLFSSDAAQVPSLSERQHMRSLVSRLARALRMTAPDHSLAEEALGYLRDSDVALSQQGDAS